MKQIFVGLPTLAMFAAGVLTLAEAPPRAIQIHADLTGAPRQMYRADVEIPVKRGPLELVTPEWIPGSHGPSGPVHAISGLRFEANGKVLPWRRDPVNTFAFHLEIPEGVSTLRAHLDCAGCGGGRTGAVLEWQDLLLYPAHTPVHEIPVQATVTVPQGWGTGTSLTPVTPNDAQHPAGGTTEYAPTTVELLQDSPILTGRFFREYPLAEGVTPRHFMDVVGPTAASVEVGPVFLGQMSHLVRECFAMYGPPHYTQYHFLVRITQQDGWGGLEHHESSDNTAPPGLFEELPASYFRLGGLLPHEFTHSWNGKFRRPDGLATPDYATPMQDNLLWVYEGLTNYLGDLMGERIGTTSQAQYRQELALTAALQDEQSGRAWRSVEDTTFTVAMPSNGSSVGGAWASWKRGGDYYLDGTMFWLNVDMTIRKLTDDKKSLHDFLLLFLQKGKPGEVRVEPYSLAELEKDLNQVVPNDWAGLIEARLYAVQPHVNTEGLEQGGYRLEYTAEPTPELVKLMTHVSSLTSWLSIGLHIDDDGTIRDVRVGSAADRAGLAPRQKMTAVDGHVYTPEALLEAIRSGKAMEVTVSDEGAVLPMTIAYTEGLRYPRLVRVEGTRDLLQETMTPLTPAKP